MTSRSPRQQNSRSPSQTQNSPSTHYFLQRGIAAAEQATASDARATSLNDLDLLQTARQHYASAVEFYNTAIALDARPRTRQILAPKVAAFATRVRQIDACFMPQPPASPSLSPRVNSRAVHLAPPSDVELARVHGQPAPTTVDARITPPEPALRAPSSSVYSTGDAAAFISVSPLITVRRARTPTPWHAIPGLSGAKALLREVCAGGTATSWRSILLYGPPGVGKRTLVSTGADAANVTSVSFHCADVLQDDGNVSTIAALVHDAFRPPSVSRVTMVVLEDVDVVFDDRVPLLSERHVVLRRAILTELCALNALSAADSVPPGASWRASATDLQPGLLPSPSMGAMSMPASHNVVVVARSTAPWHLQAAFLSQMLRRVHVDLPDMPRRTAVLEGLFSRVWHTLRLSQIEQFAKESEGYSVSDLDTLIRDAYVQSVERSAETCFFKRVRFDEEAAADGLRRSMSEGASSSANSAAAMWGMQRDGRLCTEKIVICNKDDMVGERMSVEQLLTSCCVDVGPMTGLDFEAALAGCKPSVTMETAERFRQFTRDHGLDGG